MTTLDADLKARAVSALPVHRRGKPADWTPRDYQRAPYLRGLPEMPDHIALLAGKPRLTPAEERLVDGYVCRIRQAVRVASERWNAERAVHETLPDVVDLWEEEAEEDEHALSEAAWASCAQHHRS